MENLTKSELIMLSDGLLALIDNAGKAQKLIYDHNSLKAISDHVNALQQLNSKICAMIWEDEEESE